MNRFNVRLPKGLGPILRSIYEESLRRKIELHAVGGCVRDWVLGFEMKDMDLVAEEDPIPVAQYCAQRWGGRMEVFDRFLTARVIIGSGFRIDFALAREELYLEPAALPIVHSSTLERDLIRRDFTINAMAAVLTANGFGNVMDPYGGKDDLRLKRLRVLHADSFRDDPTRMHRAARFACRFGFRLEAQTDAYRIEAVNAEWAKRLSRERLRAELVRILEERDPACALKKLKLWKLSSLFHPRLSWPATVASGKGAWQRLGMIALHMGKGGKEFVESLHLERAVSQALIEALDVAGEKAAPRTPMMPLAHDILKLSVQRLSSAALRPVYVTGRDLEALGLTPGPEFKTWLDRAAKAQWAGEFSTKSKALLWLKSKILKSARPI